MGFAHLLLLSPFSVPFDPFGIWIDRPKLGTCYYMLLYIKFEFEQVTYQLSSKTSHLSALFLRAASRASMSRITAQ